MTSAALPTSQQEDVSNEEALAEVAAQVGAGAGVDPLSALLNLDTRVSDVSETFDVPLPDTTVIEWTVRALEQSEIDTLRERCTRWVKKGRGAKVEELDVQLYTQLIVAAATQNPDLTDERLRQKFGVNRPEQLLAAILLPGTVDGLASKVLEVAGYTDDLVEAGKF